MDREKYLPLPDLVFYKENLRGEHLRYSGQ